MIRNIRAVEEPPPSFFHKVGTSVCSAIRKLFGMQPADEKIKYFDSHPELRPWKYVPLQEARDGSLEHVRAALENPNNVCLYADVQVEFLGSFLSTMTIKPSKVSQVKELINCAARYGHLDVILYVSEYIEDTSLEYMLCMSNMLDIAMEFHHSGMLIQLFERNIILTKMYRRRSMIEKFIFMPAIVHENTQLVDYLLAEGYCSGVNMKTLALITAVVHSKLEMVKLMLWHGALVNDTHYYEECILENETIAKLTCSFPSVYAYGAMTITRKRVPTALDVAVECLKSHPGWDFRIFPTLLQAMVNIDCVTNPFFTDRTWQQKILRLYRKLFTDILKELGSDYHTYEYRLNNRAKAMICLLEYGADVSVLGPLEQSVLKTHCHQHTLKNMESVISLLLEKIKVKKKTHSGYGGGGGSVRLFTCLPLGIWKGILYRQYVLKMP